MNQADRRADGRSDSQSKRVSTAKRVLIANRGEIACRVIHACREMGFASVAVFAKDDMASPHVALADFAFELSGEGPGETYNNIVTIIVAAKAMDCWAIHPGYGFLAEKAEFARAVEEAGLHFIGPRPETLALLGDKVQSTRAAQEVDLPILGQSPLLDTFEKAKAESEKIGFPLLVKSPLGGGGLGCHRADDMSELKEAFDSSSSQGKNLYGSPSVYLERYVKRARHIEVQTMGDGEGNVVHVGTRECSIQRRRQKVIEEAPAQRLKDETRKSIHEAALRLVGTLKLRSAATVEFLVEGDDFWFLEVNPRIQVEHPVTEMVFGLDLVKEQLHIAMGKGLTIGQSNEVIPRGYAIEARVYAEDSESFIPSPGRICCYEQPRAPGVRVDSGVCGGFTVTPFYDPLLAKVIAWAPSKDEAKVRLINALEDFAINGTLKTNVKLLRQILLSKWFTEGRYDTTTLEKRRSGESMDEPVNVPITEPMGESVGESVDESVDESYDDFLAELAAKLATYHDEKSKKRGRGSQQKSRSSSWRSNGWRSLP